MKRRCRPVAKGERGQMLFLFVGFVTVFLVMAAVVVDLSLWLAERRDVQKVADLAAAAGAQDLPLHDETAVQHTCGIAARNGYSDCSSAPGHKVTVTLLCNSGQPDPSVASGICPDGAAPGASPCNVGLGCDTIQVVVRKDGPHLFSSSSTAIDIAAGSTAGLRWRDVAIDGVLLIDSSTSMGLPPCNAEQSNDTCPMQQAREAATGFTEFLLGQGGATHLGYAAYTHCYTDDPATPTPVPTVPPTPTLAKPCLDRDSNVIDPVDSGQIGDIKDTIAAAMGHGDTNLCVPLVEAQRMLAGSSSSATRAVVLLTDGDNNVIYDADTAGDLPAGCPLPGGSQFRRQCPGNAFDFERALDMQTEDRSEVLKVTGVQVYVVGFAVCGADDGKTQYTPGYCGGIGNGDPDPVADQRLLKCIASSPAHYFRVDSAADLPNVFRQVAAAILGRRLLQ